MVKKIFWQDPYLTELNTIVHSVNGNQVTLSETIFYAFSGGQESDAGSIAGHPVLEARKEVKQIFYTLPEVHGLNGGDPVKIKIDWGRRYKLMRLHFAAEVVLEFTTVRSKNPINSIDYIPLVASKNRLRVAELV